MADYFIGRHGQSEWNLVQRIQGQTNTRLSPKGLSQSQELCTALKDGSLGGIYTSQLDRSILTAQPLASCLGIPLQSTELLNELAFGELEGKYRQALDETDQQVWDWWMEDPIQRRIPGGESYGDLLDRINVFLGGLNRIEDHSPILIVGHLRVNQVLLGRLAGLTLKESLFIRQPNNWLYHFQSGSRVKRARIPAHSGAKWDWQPGFLI